MAKNAGKLAGLAALAGAAYMMSKGKDKDKESPKGKEDTGPGYKSTETRLKTPAESIAEADKSDKSTSISTKGAAGTTTPGPDKSEPNLDVKPTPKPKSVAVTPSAVETKPLKPVSEPSDKSIKLAPEKRDLEADMSRGTRAAPKPVSTVSSSEEGMKNYVPRRTPTATPATSSTPPAPKSTVSSSAEGMKNYVPRRAPATDFTPGKVPSSAQAAANRQAVMDKAKSVASGVSDYISNFETPAERRSREAKQASGMKRGGAVKKMASGGMTSKVSSASKRADGIASRGKTRCKMY